MARFRVVGGGACDTETGATSFSLASLTALSCIIVTSSCARHVSTPALVATVIASVKAAVMVLMGMAHHGGDREELFALNTYLSGPCRRGAWAKMSRRGACS